MPEGSIRQKQDKALIFYQKWAFSCVLYPFMSFIASILGFAQPGYSHSLSFGVSHVINDALLPNPINGNQALTIAIIVGINLIISGTMIFLAIMSTKAKLPYLVAYGALLLSDFIFSICYFVPGQEIAYGFSLGIHGIFLIFFAISVVAYAKLYRLFKRKQK